jgi:hypothetical protein
VKSAPLDFGVTSELPSLCNNIPTTAVNPFDVLAKDSKKGESTKEKEDSSIKKQNEKAPLDKAASNKSPKAVDNEMAKSTEANKKSNNTEKPAINKESPSKNKKSPKEQPLKGSEQKSKQANVVMPTEPANINPFGNQSYICLKNPLYTAVSSSQKAASPNNVSDNPFLPKQAPVQKIMSPVKEKKKSELELLFNPFENYNPSVIPKDESDAEEDSDGGEDAEPEVDALNMDMKNTYQFSKMFVGKIEKGSGILSVDTSKENPRLIGRNMLGRILMEGCFMKKSCKVSIKESPQGKYLVISILEFTVLEFTEGKWAPNCLFLQFDDDKSYDTIMKMLTNNDKAK